MIDFKNIVALRESIIRKRGEKDPNQYRYNRDDMILFETVKDLSLPFEARRIDLTLLCICTSGSCKASIDTRHMEFSANQTLLAFPGQTVQIHSFSDDFDSIVFCTSRERYQSLLSQTQDIVPLLLYCRH